MATDTLAGNFIKRGDFTTGQKLRYLARMIEERIKGKDK